MPKVKLTNKFIDSIKVEKRDSFFDTELTGFLVRAYESGRKSYCIQYKKNGRSTIHTISDVEKTTLIQAKTEAKRLFGELASGADITSKKTDAMTLGEFISDSYQSWILKNLKSHKKVMQILSKFKQFMSYKLDDIEPQIINRFCHKYQRERDISNATVNRMIATIKGVMTKAYELGYTETNKLQKLKSLKEISGTVRYLSSDESQRLMAVLQSFDSHIRSIVICAYYTGMRKGEIFTLRWRDIDFDGNQIHIHPDNAKSSKGRSIPIHSELRKVFDSIDMRSRNDYVFTTTQTQTGKHIIDIDKSWKKVINEAKIENFRFHDLRHNFASQLVMKGESIAVIRELLGHSDFKMTLRYAHLAPEQKRKAIDLL